MGEFYLGCLIPEGSNSWWCYVRKWKITSKSLSNFKARDVRQVREWQIATNQSLISLHWAVQTNLQFLLNTSSVCCIDENSMYLIFMPRSHCKPMPPGISAVLKLLFIQDLILQLLMLFERPFLNWFYKYELQKAMLPKGIGWHFMCDEPSVGFWKELNLEVSLWLFTSSSVASKPAVVRDWF